MTNPINPITNEILGAIEAGFYCLPVVLAAALPDMCAALESDDGRSSAVKYKAWFNRWVSHKMTFISADDCYSFRCGVVHQGRMGNLQHNVARILFPLPSSNYFANNLVNDAYLYGVREFCTDMVDCTNDWYAAKADDANVLNNAKNLMRIHPNGMQPYIRGLPLLA